MRERDGGMSRNSAAGIPLDTRNRGIQSNIPVEENWDRRSGSRLNRSVVGNWKYWTGDTNNWPVD